MGWRMVEEKFRKRRNDPQAAAQDVTVTGNSVSEVVTMTQGKNVVAVDPHQITAIYQRLIQIGAVEAVAA